MWKRLLCSLLLVFIIYLALPSRRTDRLTREQYESLVGKSAFADLLRQFPHLSILLMDDNQTNATQLLNCPVDFDEKGRGTLHESCQEMMRPLLPPDSSFSKFLLPYRCFFTTGNVTEYELQFASISHIDHENSQIHFALPNTDHCKMKLRTEQTDEEMLQYFKSSGIRLLTRPGRPEPLTRQQFELAFSEANLEKSFSELPWLSKVFYRSLGNPKQVKPFEDCVVYLAPDGKGKISRSCFYYLDEFRQLVDEQWIIPYRCSIGDNLELHNGTIEDISLEYDGDQERYVLYFTPTPSEDCQRLWPKQSQVDWTDPTLKDVESDQIRITNRDEL